MVLTLVADKKMMSAVLEWTVGEVAESLVRGLRWGGDHIGLRMLRCCNGHQKREIHQ